MKRNLVGVVAISIAALLFAGCQGDSKLSPAQKELKKQLCDRLSGEKEELERFLRVNNNSGRNGSPEYARSLQKSLDENLVDRATAGC